ncbi:integrase [Hymenobacter frigidus]|uniref:Integrase n=1 Tax=Hymenobacter frigidus TaxID=1524095 RepID=A0ABQ2AB12_9BACT|nr:tyrosine-type recombinase/integrase [Hymenobacter frigidus]GGH88142.1 integrase [Hymenobacter frigidus]
MKHVNETRNALETKLRLVNISQATQLGSIVAQYSHGGKVKWFPTGYRVREKNWNAVKLEIRPSGIEDVPPVSVEDDKKNSTGTKPNPVATANNKLKDFKSKLDTIIREYFQQHGEKPTIKQVEVINDIAKEASPPEAPKLTNVIDALGAFIETKDVKPNSLKVYSALQENLRGYKEDKKQDWDVETLTVDAFDEFQGWLTSRGFHNTTVERRVIAMKKFLESHQEQLGFHYKDLKPKYKVKPPKNLVVITLSIEELKALEALDLTHNPRMHRVQQLFLLQAWSGLRFSDVVRLNASHVDGDTVRIDISKTDDFSSVPLFPTAGRILAEIGTEPISVSNQEYNRVLKDVMKVLAETTPSLQKSITQLHAVGKRKTQTTKAKWQWITTHTARRSFVTMCIQKSVPQHFTMKWSNHSDPRSFRKYQNAMQGEVEAARQFIDAFNA